MSSLESHTHPEPLGFGGVIAKELLSGLASGFPSISNNISNISNYIIGIDTLRAQVYRDTFHRFLSSHNKKFERVRPHTKVSINAKNKKSGGKRYLADNGVIIKPSQEKNGRTYEIEAYGLAQYKKPKRDYDFIQCLFYKFGLSGFDLAIDFEKPLDIKCLNKYGRGSWFQSTYYLNRPIGLEHIERVKYYDKARQSELSYPVYRLEITCRVLKRVKASEGIQIPTNEIKSILEAITA